MVITVGNITSIEPYTTLSLSCVEINCCGYRHLLLCVFRCTPACLCATVCLSKTAMHIYILYMYIFNRNCVRLISATMSLEQPKKIQKLYIYHSAKFVLCSLWQIKSGLGNNYNLNTIYAADIHLYLFN